jgi:hypothetical protein
MTDYSNMTRGEAVERCIGLEREVKRMAEALHRLGHRASFTAPGDMPLSDQLSVVSQALANQEQ